MILSDFKPELLRNPGSTPVDEFIEFYLGLSVDYANLSTDNNILGMIAFNDGMVEVFDDSFQPVHREVREGTIFIDNSLLQAEKNGRCRFTLGHEPGHWIFHRHRYLRDKNQLSFLDNTGLPVAVSFKCLNKNVGKISRLSNFQTDEDWMEWQADYFSSALLMPKTPFQEFVEGSMKQFSLSKEELQQGRLGGDLFPILMLLMSIQGTFEVSCQAAAVRLYKLGYIPQKSLPLLLNI